MKYFEKTAISTEKIMRAVDSRITGFNKMMYPLSNHLKNWNRITKLEKRTHKQFKNIEDMLHRKAIKDSPRTKNPYIASDKSMEYGRASLNIANRAKEV